MANINGLRLVTKSETFHFDGQPWAMRERHTVELYQKEQLIASGSTEGAVDTDYPSLLTPKYAAEKMVEDLEAKLAWAKAQVAILNSGERAKVTK